MRALDAFNEWKSRFIAQLQFGQRWFLALPQSTRWAFLATFIAGAVFNSAFHYFTREKAHSPFDNTLMRPAPVAAQTVGTQTIVNQFITHASLQPKKEVTIRPNANVTVREVRVEIGQLVNKGDILASTSSESQSLRSELDQIELKLKNLDFKVTMELAKKSFLSEKEFQQKELEHRASRIRRRLAEIDTMGAILSPITGIVSEIALKSGDFVDNPSTYYIKIADASALRLQIFLPQAVAAKLVKGDEATLSRSHADELGVEQIESAKGMVGGVAPVVDPKTGSVLTEIDIDSVPKTWIPGMFVQVSMVIEESADTLAVPNESIIYDSNQSYVFRIGTKTKTEANAEERTLASSDPQQDEPESVQKVPVKTGLRDGKFTEVLEGLEEFDMIVTEGQGTLADGSKVEIVR